MEIQGCVKIYNHWVTLSKYISERIKLISKVKIDLKSNIIVFNQIQLILFVFVLIFCLKF